MKKSANITQEADLMPESRKKDHIELALSPAGVSHWQDDRFDYEPLLAAHPEKWKPFKFLNKTFSAPLWVSSMTGGTENAALINQRLATIAGRYGYGMGLGSCRSLLYSREHLGDFAMRKFIGDEMPLYANLGIAQVEELVNRKKWKMIDDMIAMTEADGLIVHVNPIQEWLQVAGDRIMKAPIKTISTLLEHIQYPIIVKEVGQGMGPRSLKALLELPIAAIEFGALGGTNFGAIELQRDKESQHAGMEPLVHIGHRAAEMAKIIHHLQKKKKQNCTQFIVSGGIKDFLDGYYCMELLKSPAVIGQAGNMLRMAIQGIEPLEAFVQNQIKGLNFARAYLKIKD